MGRGAESQTRQMTDQQLSSINALNQQLLDALFLSALCDPEQGLAVGCKVLRKKFDAMAGDAARALLAWNGGANAAYPAQVLARKAHYL